MILLSKSIANTVNLCFKIELRYRIRYLQVQVFGKKRSSGKRGQSPHAFVEFFFFFFIRKIAIL